MEDDGVDRSERPPSGWSIAGELKKKLIVGWFLLGYVVNSRGMENKIFNVLAFKLPCRIR